MVTDNWLILSQVTYWNVALLDNKSNKLVTWFLLMPQWVISLQLHGSLSLLLVELLKNNNHDPQPYLKQIWLLYIEIKCISRGHFLPRWWRMWRPCTDIPDLRQAGWERWQTGATGVWSESTDGLQQIQTAGHAHSPVSSRLQCVGVMTSAGSYSQSVWQGGGHRPHTNY